MWYRLHKEQRKITEMGFGCMKAIVLAAGKGKRLQSEQFNLPKVLREANGEPLIGHVLSHIDFIEKNNTVIVVGYMKEKVMEAVGGAYRYSVQEEQKGTGHAVACAREQFEGYDGDVLILYGDMPLVRRETYQAIIEKHRASGADCTLLTAVVDDPPAYGRIVRDADGKVKTIVEDKDCDAEQKKIKELNVGIYVFKAPLLFEGLKKLKNSNAQGEYYLTDMPMIFIDEGKRVDTYSVDSLTEIYGVNTVEDLAFCEQELAKQK